MNVMHVIKGDAITSWRKRSKDLRQRQLAMSPQIQNKNHAPTFIASNDEIIHATHLSGTLWMLTVSRSTV